MTGANTMSKVSAIGVASGLGAVDGIDFSGTAGKQFSSRVEYQPTHISAVNHTTFERLLELTCGHRGMMQGLALDLRKHGVPTTPHVGLIVMARKGDLLVGWTIIDYRLRAEIYVDPGHRRQGIATGLLRKMHEVRGPTDGHYFMPYVKQIIERARAA